MNATDPNENWWTRMPKALRRTIEAVAVFFGLFVLWVLISGDEPPPDDSDLRVARDTSERPADFLARAEALRAEFDAIDPSLQDVYVVWGNRHHEPDQIPELAEVEAYLTAHEPALEIFDDLLAEPVWHSGLDPDAGIEAISHPIPAVSFALPLSRVMMMRAWLKRRRGNREGWREALQQAADLQQHLAEADQTFVNVLVLITLVRMHLAELEQAWVEDGWEPGDEVMPAPIQADIFREAFGNEYRIMTSMIQELEDSPDADRDAFREMTMIGSGREIDLVRLGGIAPNRCRRLLAEYMRAMIREFETGQDGWIERTELHRMMERPRKQRVLEFVRFRNGGGYALLERGTPTASAILGLFRVSKARQDMLLTARALSVWERRHDSLPDDLGELVTSGLVDELPLDPTGTGPIGYDPARRLLWVEGLDDNPAWSALDEEEEQERKQGHLLFDGDGENQNACPQMRLPLPQDQEPPPAER